MLCIIFSKLLGLLLGNYTRVGATPSKRPTETTLTVAVDLRDGGLLIKYMFIMDQITYLSATLPLSVLAPQMAAINYCVAQGR